LDLDGNTKLKSNAGHSGNDSSIVSNAVQFADRKFQAENLNECNRLFSAVESRVNRPEDLRRKLRIRLKARTYTKQGISVAGMLSALVGQ
jgi:hypothetical protein